MGQGYAGNAIVLQEPQSSSADYFQNMMERRHRYERDQEARRDAREKQYVDYIGEELDFKNIGTGTPYDQVFVKEGSTLKNKFLTALKQNRDMNPADLAYMVNTDVSKLISKVQVIKQLKTNIAESLKGVDGINKEKAINLAMHDAIMKEDGKGGKTFKELDEINPSADYKGYVMDNYFDDVSELSGDDLMASYFKNKNKGSAGDVYVHKNADRSSIRKKYSTSIYPEMQEIYTDPKTGERSVRTKSIDMLDEKGNPTGAKVIDPEIYRDYTSDEMRDRQLTNAVNKGLLERGIKISKHSVEFETEKRKYLLQKFKGWEDPVKTENDTRSAPINIINGSGNGQSGNNSGNEFLKNTMSAIQSGDDTKIQDAFSVLHRGGKYVDIATKKEGDEIIVSYKTPTGIDPNNNDKVIGGEVFQEKFKNDGTLSDKLKGFYQRLTGSDAKFEKSEAPRQQTTAPKEKTVHKKGILD